MTGQDTRAETIRQRPDLRDHLELLARGFRQDGKDTSAGVLDEAVAAVAERDRLRDESETRLVRSMQMLAERDAAVARLETALPVAIQAFVATDTFAGGDATDEWNRLCEMCERLPDSFVEDARAWLAAAETGEPEWQFTTEPVGDPHALCCRSCRAAAAETEEDEQ